MRFDQQQRPTLDTRTGHITNQAAYTADTFNKNLSWCQANKHEDLTTKFVKRNTFLFTQ